MRPKGVTTHVKLRSYFYGNSSLISILYLYIVLVLYLRNFEVNPVKSDEEKLLKDMFDYHVKQPSP